MRLIISIILVSIASSTFCQLSKVEKKISQAVEANNKEAVELLKQSVNINSGTMNFDGVRKVGELFKHRLDALGFKTTWVDGTPFNRAGHLVAYHTGNATGKTILLIGHLDTVFEPSSPFQSFVLVNDSTATGPGSSDMKGGDVIIIYSLEALQKVGLLKNMNIIVVMTGDEEASGYPLELAKRDLIEAAKAADFAIGFEDGDDNPHTGVISRRSSSGWELTVTGNAAHSSQIFTEQVGAGAIYEASRILHQFYEQLSSEKDLTFNPGMIIGGNDVKRDSKLNGGSAFGKSNIVSRQVIVTGDIRAVSQEQFDRAQRTMEEIVSQHLPGTDATIKFKESMYPPMARTDGNAALLKLYNNVSLDLGLGEVVAVNPRDAGAADISFVANNVDMAIDGLGLFGGNGHTENEYANLNWLPRQTKRAAILLYRLGQSPSAMKK